MKLSEMRLWLDSRGIQLTKSLGQNFLHDAHQLERIVATAGVQPGDLVLEIGPGLGPLTERLLAAGAHVLAIEKDARLVAVLRERFAAELSAGTQCGAPTGSLTLEHADALDHLRSVSRDWSGWKLVANLPYSVASPMLVELAGVMSPPGVLVITLQLEVARRLIARAGTDDYGVLTLLVQLRYEPGELFMIPAGCFFPEPDVTSACVTMRRRASPLLNEAEPAVFKRLVKLAFSQRRKMMLKLLKQNWPVDRLTGAFATLGIDEKIRAEKVSLPQFVELTKLLA